MLNKVMLIKLYTEQKKSIPDIARMFEIPRSRVRRILIKNEIPIRSRADGVRASVHKLGAHCKGVKRNFTDEWRKNIGIGRSNSPKIKGTRITTHGYIEFTVGENKGRLQHVVLMEAEIGRRLEKHKPQKN